MVSQNSNTDPSIPHQFITTYSMTSQPQLWNQNSAASYQPDLGTSIHSLGERMSRAIDLVHSPQVSHTRHLMDLLGSQKLSLSLGSPSLVNPGFVNPGMGCFSSDYSVAASDFSSSSSTSVSTFSGAESFAAIIANSKYLKPAQSLLEEVVIVGGKATDSSNEKYIRRLSPTSKKGSLGFRSIINAEFPSNEKHELHSKIMELIALLEGVNSTKS